MGTTVHERSFYMNRSMGSVDGGAFPAQNMAEHAMLPDARRTAVPEEGFPHAVRLFRQAQGANLDCQTAFFMQTDSCQVSRAPASISFSAR